MPSGGGGQRQGQHGEHGAAHGGREVGCDVSDTIGQAAVWKAWNIYDEYDGDHWCIPLGWSEPTGLRYWAGAAGDLPAWCDDNGRAVAVVIVGPPVAPPPGWREVLAAFEAAEGGDS